ncbi:MAG: sensor histidine kinase [Owenweeksia sp.]|nr:sensor histidine kinase [Owenweeksia sp.]
MYVSLGLIVLAGVQVWALTHFLHLRFAWALTDASVHWLVLATLAYFIANTLSYYHPSYGKGILSILAPAMLTLIGLPVADHLCSWTINNPEYSAFIQNWAVYRYTVFFLILVGVTLMSLLWYRLGEKEDAQRRKEETERIAREAELFKLRQQLQPHFLFNSLNSINALIGSRPQEARNMVQQLSDFLRGTIRREDQRLVPLQDELLYLKLFLDIEQVRFGHRLQIRMHLDDTATSWQIPPLILQPLLENAIKFGVYGTTENIEIVLTSRIQDNHLELVIANPYDQDMEPPAGTGFGLKSIERRLFLLYGRKDLLEFHKDEKRFTAKVKIPKTL